MPTLKQTTTKHHTKLVHRRNEASNFRWAQPFAETWVWSICFPSCGLLWQPFSVHTFFHLVLEQSGHKKVSLSLQSPVSPCATFYPWEKDRGACEMNHEWAREPGPIAIATFWTFIYYLCVLYFKRTPSLLSSSSHSESVAFQSKQAIDLFEPEDCSVYITVFRGHLFQTFMEG